MDRRKFINYTSLTFGASILPDVTLSKMEEVPNNVIGIRIVAPSIVVLNQEFELGVGILTEPYFASTKPNWHDKNAAVAGPFNVSPRGIRYMQNILQEWDGMVSIEGDPGYLGPSKFDFSYGEGPNENDKRPIRKIGRMKFSTPGIKYIRLTDPNSGKVGVSNPIHVVAEKPKAKLFWGDLHMHSLYTDGIRIPEQVYSFARDEAFLDICAMSDHSEGLSNLQWKHFTEVTNNFYNPGKFVTIVGGEWTNMKFGHRNYYYRGQDGPILQCDNPKYKDLNDFYLAARKHGALVIPHHTASAAMGVDWSLGHDPLVERLVEIHSIWGNSERPSEDGNPIPIQTQGGEKKEQHVVDGLAKGYKLGIIAGGDIHDGRPGDELHHLQKKPDQYYLLRKQGIMGVWAEELTREAIFDALWNRRVYGTTNHRTILLFSINDQPMGSEIKLNGELNISVEVTSNAPISRIDLVKDGLDVKSYKAKTDELNISWKTKELPTENESYYYIRVTLSDGENLAWSSPIWVSK